MVEKCRPSSIPSAVDKEGRLNPLTCWFDVKPIHHADEAMCLQQVEVLEAHVLQLLLQLAGVEVLWDTVVFRVLLDTDKEEG